MTAGDQAGSRGDHRAGQGQGGRARGAGPGNQGKRQGEGSGDGRAGEGKGRRTRAACTGHEGGREGQGCAGRAGKIIDTITHTSDQLRCLPFCGFVLTQDGCCHNAASLFVSVCKWRALSGSAIHPLVLPQPVARGSLAVGGNSVTTILHRMRNERLVKGAAGDEGGGCWDGGGGARQGTADGRPRVAAARPLRGVTL